VSRARFLPLVVLLLLPRALPAAPAEKGRPSVLRIVAKGGKFELLRDGKPYFIRGAGGDGSLEALAKAGGNSVRTWGAEKLGAVLDEAHRHGLTVAAGIWLGHERHGFNYNDADMVARQYEEARRIILRHKDHPALLLWAIGNEMEGHGRGDNAAVWSAINNLAALAKKLDPNHPTMTVVAEIGGDRVKNIHRLCPDIDIVGINSYAGAVSLPGRYRAAGGTKPFILTEFGPPGSWEVKKTKWGAALEPTSAEKAVAYRRAYEGAVVAAKGLCLGSYAFVWGHKQEATATWFGMFLPDGSRLAAVDVMSELWLGRPPARRCPVIEVLTLDGPEEVAPGATVRASLKSSGGKGARVRWVLQGEPSALGVGGDAEEVPPTYPEAIVKAGEKSAEVRMPKGGGGYRLFAYVRDEHGGAAVANVPLFVKGPVVVAKAARAKLPLVVQGEGKAVYAPSGWMGNTKGLRLDPASGDMPRRGKTCLRVDYLPADGWAGVAWQSPAGDWGDRPGGRDLTGARRLTFWARGAKGGEVVTFEMGIIGKDKRFSDTARGKLDKVRLTAEWKQYAIDLTGKDLSRVKTGFVFVLAGQGGPVTFYLDDVRYE
jgi:hypothetical protein